jgi:hypothetical protein
VDEAWTHGRVSIRNVWFVMAGQADEPVTSTLFVWRYRAAPGVLGHSPRKRSALDALDLPGGEPRLRALPALAAIVVTTRLR